MTLAELRARLAEVRDEMRTLADLDADTMTDEQETRFDELVAELEGSDDERGLLDNIERAENRERLLERANDAATRGDAADAGERGGNSPAPAAGDRSRDPFDLDTLRVSPFASGDEVATQLRGRAETALERMQFTSDDHRERAGQLLNADDNGTLARRMIECGSPAYERAFRNYIAGRPLTGDEARALTVGTDSEGGYAVPVTLDPTVILTAAQSVNPLRQISRTETITTAKWQGLTSAGITVTRKAEAAEATDDSPTFAQPEAVPQRVDAFVQFSFEIDQDWGQMRGELARMIAAAKDEEEATSFVTGDGTGVNPEGIVGALAAGSVVDTAASGTFASGDVYALDDDLPDRYRANARVLADNRIYNVIRQFPSSDGHDLWARIGAGRPAELLGYQAFTASAMDGTVSAGNDILLMGDFQNFLIVDRVGMSVEYVPHIFGANRRPTGQRGLFAFWRNTSKILVDDAFRLLNVAA